MQFCKIHLNIAYIYIFFYNIFVLKTFHFGFGISEFLSLLDFLLNPNLESQIIVIRTMLCPILQRKYKDYSDTAEETDMNLPGTSDSGDVWNMQCLLLHVAKRQHTFKDFMKNKNYGGGGREWMTPMPFQFLIFFKFTFSN